MSDFDVLKEVVEMLETSRLDYWLGRGRFRGFERDGRFLEDKSDIDFHIQRKDVQKLRNLLPVFKEMRYEIYQPIQGHKISITKDDPPRKEWSVDFMVLKADSAKRGFLYHEMIIRPSRPSCPARVFGKRRVEIQGVSVRVPEAEYLEYVPSH